MENDFVDKILYAGVLSVSAKPDSIYQKSIEIGESFAKSDEIMVVLLKGKGYALINGKKYEY